MADEKAAKHLVNAMRTRGLATVSKAVKLLVDANRTHKPAAIGDLALHTEQEAYRVQDEVFADLWPGAKPAAWKAGGPSDEHEPTAAPIPLERVLASPAGVSASSMNMVGVEAEVAFRLAKDLPPRTRPYSDRSAQAAVGEVLVAIELCDTRLADWKGSSGIWKLADFQNSGGLVTGSGTRNWQKIDFLQQEVEFMIGSRVRKAKGAHSFGNPLRLMSWIANHCSRRGVGLRAGDIITTGAWTGLEIAAAGDTVSARFPGIGEATVKIS
jgi:2-keto-4-pentenoate hydratase